MKSSLELSLQTAIDEGDRKLGRVKDEYEASLGDALHQARSITGQRDDKAALATDAMTAKSQVRTSNVHLGLLKRVCRCASVWMDVFTRHVDWVRMPPDQCD